MNARASEKRVAQRAAADFVVEMYEMDGRTLMGVARLLNLSEFGACVETTSTLGRQETIVVRLLLGRRHLLTLPADVVWSKPRHHTREYGLRFGELPEMVKNMIQKFVVEYFEKADDL